MLALSAAAVLLLAWMVYEFRTAPYLDDDGQFIDYKEWERQHKEEK